MATAYLLVKFLHILAAIAWLGGTLSFMVIVAHLAREANPTVLGTVARLIRFYGGVVIVPAAALQLLTGLVMSFRFGLGFPLWILWGLAAVTVVVALVQIALLPTIAAVINTPATTTADDPRLTSLRRRLVMVYGMIVLVLLSAEWAMVFKPTW